MFSPTILVVLFFFLSLFTATTNASSWVASADQQYVDGLLTRQLFSLAEAYCSQELARDDLTDRRRVELTVELSRTHALEALSLSRASRDVAWQAAHDVLTELAQRDGQNPCLPLVRRQHAMVQRARGDLLRQEAEVVSLAAPLRRQARAQLRKAIATLEELTADLKETEVRASRQRSSGGGFTENELRNLREEVGYQLGRTLVSQARTYPEGSTDRTNSIVRAKRQFALLAEREEPIDWRSRLGLARCERILKNEETARRQLSSLVEKAPPQVAAAAQLELARLDIDAGRFADARETLQQRTKQRGVAPAWDHEYLRTLLALRAAAESPQDADRLEHFGNDLVRQIEKQHGLYWLRRAEALLGRHIAASPHSQDAETLARAAANFYRSDKPDEAIATYDKAVRLALSVGDAEQAFDLAFTAATIEHQRKQHATARDRFHAMALAQPEHARAAQAHLLAVFNASKLVRSNTAGAFADYVELLEEHLQKWPAGETAAQVHIWLGNVRRARGDWADAMRHFRAVPATSPLYAKALQAVVKGYDNWLASLEPDDPQRRAVARRAAAFYTELLLADGGELPPQLSALQQTLLLGWARVRMVYLQEGYDEMEQFLRVAVKSAAADTTPAWKAKARSLLVLALAGQPRQLEQANAFASQLAGTDGEELIRLVLALNGLREQSDGPREQQLAELQLAIVEQFQKLLDEAEPKVRRRLNVARAAALVEAKRFDLARQRYAELAKAFPSDGDVQRRFAEVLSHPSVAKDDATWQAALEQWRLIERRSGKATPAWFDAKYHQALAQHRLGNSEQALRIIKLTKALHPELGGAERRRKLVELEKECGG